MRISTNNFFDASSARLSDLQARLDQTSQQIASGRKLLSPAQDPAAAVRVLELSQAKAVDAQYATNRVALRNTLGVADSTLSGMQDTLAGIQEQVVQAGNGTLSASDLKAIADVLQADSDQLLAQVNAADGTGRHLFAGQKPEVPPFVQNGTEITYQGSQSEQVVQVDAGRAIAIGADGQALLPADLPAAAPSGTVSKNLFGRLADTISVLQDASTTPQQRSDALKLLGSALNATRDAVSRRQTVVGTNLDELDRLDSMASSRDLQNSQTLASLQDLDYNQALSDLSRQQLILQASQKTFQQISSLSLFNYLS